MLHVEDARAGREFLRRLAPHVDSAAEWWQAGERLDLGRHHLRRAGGAGRAGGLAAELPGSVPRGDGRARRQLRDYGPNDPEHWDRRSGAGRSTSGSASSATPKRRGAAPWRRRGSSTRDLSGHHRADDAGLRRPAGRPQPAGLQGLDRSARHRGQRRRAAARPGPPIKAGEFILGYPGEAGVPLPMPRPDVLGRNGTFVGLRKYQSRVGTFNRFLREHAETEQERELLAAKLVGRWRSGAPLTLAPTQDDPALGADPRRNNDFTYADDPDGRQVPLGSHMRRMNPRDTELALLADVNVHRDHPAQHDLRGAVRPGRDLRRRTTRSPAGSTSSSSAPRRWPRWSSCSRSGSTTATS